MINVQPPVIEQYLTDSVNKAIEIDATHDGGIPLEDVNYYTGDITSSNYISLSRNGTYSWIQLYATEDTADIDWSDNVNFDYIDDYDYVVVAMKINFNVVSGSITSSSASWRLSYHKTGDSEHIYYVDLGSADMDAITTGTKTPLVFHFKKPANMADIINIDLYYNGNSVTAEFDTQMAAVQVNFLNDAYYTPPYYPAPDFTTFDPDEYGTYKIDNDNLIYEDFSLTESLCSQKNLKFGLCEAAHCEFSEIGVNAVKVGDVLKVNSVLPDYISDITDNDIFAINWVGNTAIGLQSWTGDVYGWHDIMHAPYSPYWGEYMFSLGLASKRLYYQFNLKFVFDNLTGQKPTYFKFRYWAPINGEIWWFNGNYYYNVADYDNTYNLLSTWDNITRNAGAMGGMKRFAIMFYDENKQEYAQGVNTGDIMIYSTEMQFRIGAPGHTMPAYNQNDMYYASGTLDAYLSQWKTQSIPLGVFEVASVANEYKHNIIRKKITAYDKLVTLENNAADWYTRYMFGVDFYGYTDAGFEYARQIFSTYWSYVSSIGLDSVDNYEITDFATLSDSDFICYSGSCYGYVKWDYSVGNTFYRAYAAKEVAISDPTLLYRVTYDNYDDMTDDEIIETYNPYYIESGADTMLRGFGTIGGVLIEEYKTGVVDPINRICVNRGDFFMLTPDTTSIKVVLPSGSKASLGFSLCQNIKVQTAPRRQELTNGHLRLCYYNYAQKTIFACDSSITGRDVVRSLLEVCGCFFRLDRYNGLPEFVYPTKGGLYPSNTLYPADDLYPRAGTDQLYPMGKYISVTAENYQVKDFGRIQILKKIKSANTESVVEWQYEGDPDAENTYIIDDNIFYCAEEMEYDYDGMPEVADMLKGMWDRIGNLGYTPNTTQALGAPWLECGDRVGLLTYDGGFETFVFRRTLKGIQNLRDTYESEGDELNPAISNYGYSV